MLFCHALKMCCWSSKGLRTHARQPMISYISSNVALAQNSYFSVQANKNITSYRNQFKLEASSLCVGASPQPLVARVLEYRWNFFLQIPWPLCQLRQCQCRQCRHSAGKCCARHSTLRWNWGCLVSWTYPSISNVENATLAAQMHAQSRSLRQIGCYWICARVSSSAHCSWMLPSCWAWGDRPNRLGDVCCGEKALQE